MKAKIIYNPDCSKSRTALEQLEQVNAVDIDVINYLETPPSEAFLKHICQLLNCHPKAITRINDCDKAGLPSDQDNDQAWLSWLAHHIEYLQRPIIIIDDRHAIIARPPHDLVQFLQQLKN